MLGMPRWLCEVMSLLYSSKMSRWRWLYSINTLLGTLRKRGLSAGVKFFLFRYTLICLLTSKVGWPHPPIRSSPIWVSNHIPGLVYKHVVCSLTRLIFYFIRLWLTVFWVAYDSLSHCSYVFRYGRLWTCKLDSKSANCLRLLLFVCLAEYWQTYIFA